MEEYDIDILQLITKDNDLEPYAIEDNGFKTGTDPKDLCFSYLYESGKEINIYTPLYKGQIKIRKMMGNYYIEFSPLDLKNQFIFEMSQLKIQSMAKSILISNEWIGKSEVEEIVKYLLDNNSHIKQSFKNKNGKEVIYNNENKDSYIETLIEDSKSVYVDVSTHITYIYSEDKEINIKIGLVYSNIKNLVLRARSEFKGSAV